MWTTPTKTRHLPRDGAQRAGAKRHTPVRAMIRSLASRVVQIKTRAVGGVRRPRCAAGPSAKELSAGEAPHRRAAMPRFMFCPRYTPHVALITRYKPRHDVVAPVPLRQPVREDAQCRAVPAKDKPRHECATMLIRCTRRARRKPNAKMHLFMNVECDARTYTHAW